jgi:hypothetical protein
VIAARILRRLPLSLSEKKECLMMLLAVRRPKNRNSASCRKALPVKISGSSASEPENPEFRPEGATKSMVTSADLRVGAC